MNQPRIAVKIEDDRLVAGNSTVDVRVLSPGRRDSVAG
jgi:hypothetical protein